MPATPAPAPATRPALSPRLSEAVDRLHLDPLGPAALVDGARITADTVPGLRHALANKLYEVLHAGLGPSRGPRPRTLRDEAYETLLAQAVPHRETVVRVPTAAVREASDDAHRTVLLDGVRTLVPKRLLSDGLGRDEVTVRYPCARPALSAGFFLVDGSPGRPVGTDTVRLYVHIEDSGAAPGIWRRLLLRLEAATVPYRAKVSSSPLLYPRRDAAVVYLDAAHGGEELAGEAAAAVAGRPGLGAGTSVFAREIAPGLALAAEPDDPRKGLSHMSFGQHRAHAVAQGLVDHALAPDAADKHTAVVRALTRARIRPDEPWRNTPRPAPAPDRPQPHTPA
ncbi:T3SS effector HopA1 family protein [Streptomyces sp. SudanB91_2054]|uniref:T3SS effector HopA1 family protein n=1 Tax=Streptomyces sp. SudanB91_2054 TaxID=3035278 RepID=UPI0036D97FA6